MMPSHYRPGGGGGRIPVAGTSSKRSPPPAHHHRHGGDGTESVAAAGEASEVMEIADGEAGLDDTPAVLVSGAGGAPTPASADEAAGLAEVALRDNPSPARAVQRRAIPIPAAGRNLTACAQAVGAARTPALRVPGAVGGSRGPGAAGGGSRGPGAAGRGSRGVRLDPVSFDCAAKQLEPVRVPATEVASQGFLTWFDICSSKNFARACLLIMIMTLLITKFSQVPVIDNANDTCPATYKQLMPRTDNTTDICPASYLQFKQPILTDGAKLFQILDPQYKVSLKRTDECPAQSKKTQWILGFGAIISAAANFIPWHSAIAIANLVPRRILLLGLSCLLSAEANIIWIAYLSSNKCANKLSIYLAILHSLWNLVYTYRFGSHTAVTMKHTLLILSGCVVLALIGFANPIAAGVFGLIFTSCGHLIRIMSAWLDAQRFNKITLILAFCGTGSRVVVYQLDIATMTMFKIAALISCGARIADFCLQLYCYRHDEQLPQQEGYVPLLDEDALGEQGADALGAIEEGGVLPDEDLGEQVADVMGAIEELPDEDLGEPVAYVPGAIEQGGLEEGLQECGTDDPPTVFVPPVDLAKQAGNMQQGGTEEPSQESGIHNVEDRTVPDTVVDASMEQYDAESHRKSESEKTPRGNGNKDETDHTTNENGHSASGSAKPASEDDASE